MRNDFETRSNSCGNQHGVRVAFFIDGKLDGFAPAYARNGLALLIATVHGCDITQVNGPVDHIGDNRIAHLVDGLELIQCSYQETLIAFFEAAARQIDVFSSDAGRNLVDADA